MPYTNHSVPTQIMSVSSQQAPTESPISGALEDSRQGKSFSWEMLCQSSCPRSLLWSSPHKYRTWRGSLSGGPVIFSPLQWSLVYSHSSLQDLLRFLYWAVAIEMKLGQLTVSIPLWSSVLGQSLQRVLYGRQFPCPPCLSPPPSSTGRTAHRHCSPALRSLLLAATHREELPEETANRDRPSGSCLQAWSTLFKYTHNSSWEPGDTPRAPHCSPARTRADASLTSQFPALNVTFFQVQRTDPTSVMQVVLFCNNRRGMKSPAVPQRCVF